MNSLYRSLIKELLYLSIDNRSGINAKEFRAKHEEHLDILDQLEQSLYIEKKDNLYHVKLLTLAEFKDDDSKFETIFRQCEQVFCFLSAMYKERTDAPVTLKEIIQKTEIPESQLRLALTYLLDAPIWGGRTSDLLHSEEVHIAPSERVLRYKTFNDVIQQLRDWASKSSNVICATTSDQSHNPLFLREMKNEYLPELNNLPKWYEDLPLNIHKMLLEVRYALQKEMSALPSMGLRSVIDMICNERLGDIGNFGDKLHKLEEKRLITPKKRQIIENILEVGHASVHRGHFPTAKDLRIVMDIVDHILQELYVLDKASKTLKESVPKRKIKK